MNSEIYGIATSVPWGFIFVREGETLAKHPTQIYEALAYLFMAALLVWFYYKKIWFSQKGVIFGFLLIILFGFRFMIEYIKNPQADFELGLPLYMGQILSLPFILAGVWLMARGLKSNK
jgi:prolipoprotein diacylglyceryltransferase